MHHSRPRLIYLPGIDGTGRLLHRQPHLFEQYDVRCIRYPQNRPNTYDELVELAEVQLLPEGAIVLAESFGGAIALMLALKRPELVQRLVLVNTFAWFPRQPLIHLLRYCGRYLPPFPVSSWTRGLRGRFFFPPDIPKPQQDEWWDLTSDVPMRVYGMRIGMIAKLDLRPRLAEIQTPTIVFIAPNDRIVPPPAGRLLARRLPQATRIELAAGHAAMIHPAVDIAAMLREGTFAQFRVRS